MTTPITVARMIADDRRAVRDLRTWARNSGTEADPILLRRVAIALDTDDDALAWATLAAGAVMAHAKGQHRQLSTGKLFRAAYAKHSESSWRIHAAHLTSQDTDGIVRELVRVVMLVDKIGASVSPMWSTLIDELRTLRASSVEGDSAGDQVRRQWAEQIWSESDLPPSRTETAREARGGARRSVRLPAEDDALVEALLRDGHTLAEIMRAGALALKGA